MEEFKGIYHTDPNHYTIAYAICDSNDNSMVNTLIITLSKFEKTFKQDVSSLQLFLNQVFVFDTFCCFLLVWAVFQYYDGIKMQQVKSSKLNLRFLL